MMLYIICITFLGIGLGLLFGKQHADKVNAERKLAFVRAAATIRRERIKRTRRRGKGRR